MSDAPADAVAPFAPRVFGDYLLTAELGRGGMGTVFLAKKLSFAPDIQPFCAVKTIVASSARTSFVRRFHDEARAVVTMNHPGICHVFDVGIVDGEHYLAMELIEGVSVQELQRACVRAGERFAPELALAVIDAVLDALRYAHERRDPATGRSMHVVHRDVSPQNVMITFSGAVKLIDFGLATSSLREEQTVGGVVVGKLAYMAPEHARGEPVDARADVFSAGVLLYELLTGRRYYGGLTKGQITTHVAEGSWTPPLEDVPVHLRAPLARALEPEAAARTASCEALQRELYDAQPARAPARDLRAVLERLMPGQAERMAELLRGAAAVAPPPIGDVTRSMVTHVARSDEVPSVLAASASVTAPVRRRPSWRRGAALASVVAASALATWGAWWMVEGPPSSVADVAAPVAPVIVERPRATGAAPAVVPQADEPGDSIDGGTDAPVAAGPPRRPPRATRPPTTPLPDLAAELAYLERWCGARVPSCTRDVLAQRSRVPLLDAPGLRALRREAAACVLQCRR